MAQVERMTLEMDVIAKVDGAIGGINKIKNTLQGIKMPPKLSADLEKSFSNLSGLFERYKDQVKNGFNTKGDVSSFAKTAKQIDNEVDRLSRNLHKLTGEKLSLNIETDRLKTAQGELTKLIAQKEKLMSDIKGSFGLDNYFKAFKDSSVGRRGTKINDAANIMQTSLQHGDLLKALEDVKALEAEYNRMSQIRKDAFAKLTGVSGDTAIQQLKTSLQTAVQETNRLDNSIKTTTQDLENLPNQMMNEAGQLAQRAASSMDRLATETKQVTASSTEAARASQSMSQQLQDLQQTTQYFFSLRNMINLFRRGIQDAVQSVKELDAAMTETAVVTDYKVSDLWSMLPQYTQLANELGATTQGAYETMTLYFQQGLDQQAAFEIGAETMKMARIAGLDYAETTDMMTAALRGFNMELNETSAKRVNDVYSELAAITASDTEELGTAMQRTASIAHSAGASFEGATAFLAQAIETTREPAENIGTAMKTIIARFQEMKKNPLEISEVDGEEVDYNKIDAALKTIGVSLKDTNGQFRDWDKVMLDISARWDTLSQSQQRYIATTAAGSRQQSRFIAMVSNYDRTMQLMEAANNSAGASDEQFGKTMDSLEAKLNQLHNAWQAFTMGIADNGAIKFAVDGITVFLTKVNSLINTLSLGSPVLKSFLSLFTAFTGLKVAGKFANQLIGGLGGLIDPQSSFSKGFFSGAIGSKNGVNVAQAHAISDPIVQAVNNLTKSLGGKISTSNGQQSSAAMGPNYKEFTSALKNFKTQAKQPQSTIKDTLGTLTGISGKQQSMVLSSSQGTMRAMNRGMQDWLQGTSFSKESKAFGSKLINDITAGMSKGTVSAEKISQFMGMKDVVQMAREAGPEAAQAYSKAVAHELENAKSTINQAAYKTYTDPTSELYGDFKGSIQKARKEHIAQWKENFDMSDVMIPTLTKGEQLQNTLNGLGVGATTAGQAFSSLGMILNNLGLAGVGTAFMSLGNIISSVGMTVSGIGNAFPNLFKKIGEGQKLFGALKSSIADAGLTNFMKALGGFAIAGLAIGAVVKIHQEIEKRAKENAEKVTKTYEEAISKSTEKISTLTSAKDTFNSLSKGVDQYGNNIGLAQEQYEEYLNTSREIAKVAPELIRGYDAQGNAIIATGGAIDELIAKEKELQATAVETFTNNSSINDLMGGIQVSDAFKKYGTKISGSQYSINGNAGNVTGAFNKQITAIKSALTSAGADFDSISQQLFGREINLINPSQDDLRLLAEHYNDIINLVESQNSELTEKQKEGLQDAFSGLGEGWNSMLGELEPLSQAIGQYLSSEGLDTIGLNLGEEFTESFNKGLESLTMTAAMEGWDASKIKEEARNYAEGFKAMTAEGSTYATIMEKVTAEQEKYNDAIGDPGAIDNYKAAVEDYATELETLADKYDDGTVAGQLFANSLRETAAHVRNYATESVLSLGEAINVLSNKFASARGAQERFQEATKGGDYYTAAEGFRSIADTVLDEKNSAGDGSLTAWTGAEALLGQKFVDSAKDWSEVEAQVKKVNKLFDDGVEGVYNFNDMLVEAVNSGKDLSSIGEVVDGQFHFKFDNLDNLQECADILGISEDVLAGMIDKARQFAAFNVGNNAQIRQALEQSEQTMVGQSYKEGKSSLYMSEASFRQEAYAQGIRGDDYVKTKKDLTKEQNVQFLTVDSLKANKGDLGFDNVMKDLGLSGADKNLENTVSALTKMGFDLEEQKEILKGQKLADGEATAEAIEKAYGEQEFAVENPTVAGIANDTGVIASAATAMLASMGILTQETKDNIATATDAENNRTMIKAADQDYSTGDAYLKGTSQLRTQIDDNNNTIALLQQGLDKVGANSAQGQEIQAQIDLLNEANERLGQGLADIDNKWAEKLKSAQENLQNIGKNEEEQGLIDNFAVDISSMMNTEDIGAAMQSLTAFEDAANLSHTAIANLAQEFIQLRAIDLGQLTGGELDALLTSLGLTADEAREVKNELQSPFRIETQLTGADLENYINEVDGLTSGVKSIVLNTELSGEEKVEGVIDEINNTFGDGDTKTKTVIIEATSKLASGDKEGANKLLTDAFGGDKAEEITKQLSILYDGSIVNAGELQSSLESELDSIADSAGEKTREVAMNVKANVTANFKEAKAKDQNATVNYKRGTQAEAKDSKAGVDYNKIINQVEPDNKTAGVSYNYISYQKPPETKHAKVIYDDGPHTGGFITTVGVLYRAKGGEAEWPGYPKKGTDRIPAYLSPGEYVQNRKAVDYFGIDFMRKINHRDLTGALQSFRSAAKGMNIPNSKTKKNLGNQTTALVGEEGFEIGYIPSEGRSVIFGANGPEMTAFPSDTIIYPHDQSKEILRRGKGTHKTAGSFVDGWLPARPSGNGGGGSYRSNGNGNRGGGGNDTPKSTSDQTEKEIVKIIEKAGTVLVWWENVARRMDDAQRKSQKTQKSLDKMLKVFGTSVKDYEAVGKTYKAQLENIKSIAQEKYDRANTELKYTDKKYTIPKTAGEAKTQAEAKAKLNAAKGELAKAKKKDKKKSTKKTKAKVTKAKAKVKALQGKYNSTAGAKKDAKENDYMEAIGARQEISYTVTKKTTKKDKKGKKKTTTSEETKKEKINLSKYITKDKNGVYILDQAAIAKEAKKNKSKAQAIKDAAEKQLNDLLSKQKAAEDELAKAQEEYEKFLNDTYDTFYAWDKSITEVYFLGKELEKLGDLRNMYEAATDVEFAKLTSGVNYDEASNGLQNVLEALPGLAKALEKNRDYLMQQAQTNYAKMNAAYTEYINAITGADNLEKYRKAMKGEAGLSQNAKNEFEMWKATQEFLKNSGFVGTNFDISAAIDKFNKGRLGLEAKTWKAEDYDKIKQGLDKIAEKQADYYNAITETYSSITEIYHTIEEYQSYLSDFENSLIKGIEEEATKEINQLSKINTTLSNAAKELLDEVKRKLDERRKQEDNAKTEKDISQKQQRLAALQADTSGGHQVEIAQLQKEIAESQQGYTRTLEDQLLDRLSQQQDEAAKQRERQISLMESQRDLAVALGSNVEEVNQWLTDPKKYYEQIRTAWLSQHGYDEAGAQERKQLEEQFVSEFAKFEAYGAALPELMKAATSDIFSNVANTELPKSVSEIEQRLDSILEIIPTIDELANLPQLNVTPGSISAGRLREAGFTVQDAVDYSKIQRGNAFSFKELWKGGYSAKELYSAGYKNAADYKANNISYNEAKSAGFSNEALHKAGYREGTIGWAEELENFIRKTTHEMDEIATQRSQVNQELSYAYEWLSSAKRNLDEAKLEYQREQNAIKKAKQKGGNAFVTSAISSGGNIVKVATSRVNEAQAYINRLTQESNRLYNLLAQKDKVLSDAVAKRRGLQFKTGGLANYTGPAWLDGTPSKPELVLNAQDTKNFIALKDVLSKALGSTNSVENTYGNATYEININVDHLNNDYDVDKVVERVKKKIVQDSSYRNVTQVRKFR